MTRFLAPFVAVVVLALAACWLADDASTRVALGPAEELVGRDGADRFLVRAPDGGWTLFAAEARGPDDGRALPDGVRGRPDLAADGSLLALTPRGLVLWRDPLAGAALGAPEVLLASGPIPDDARLDGRLADGRPLLSQPRRGVRRALVLADGALEPVRGPDGPLQFGVSGEVVFAPGRAAVAVLGPEGWEAWDLAADPPRRRVAEGYVGEGALFAPDGSRLILPGRMDGLWTLDLDDGVVAFMADGNFGVSRRVGRSATFRGDPLQLLMPQWGLDGFLGLFHTHLGGGGRKKFKPAFEHVYEVHASADGRFIAYCQAAFDERGDAPFTERIERFDFEHPTDTVEVDERAGGRDDRGPLFLGAGADLVYVARGQALRFSSPPQE